MLSDQGATINYGKRILGDATKVAGGTLAQLFGHGGTAGSR
jgi:hypothetical protein